MIVDVYTMMSIGTAQRNIAVLTRILDGAWDNADLFELEVFLRAQHRMQPATLLPFIDRVRTRTMQDDDKKKVEALISDERCNLYNARERHRRDVASGVKY